MSDLENIYLENELNFYRDRDDVERLDKGICEKCNTEYSYWYYRDNTPGFRCTDEVIRPCKCGKHYGWVRKTEGYKHYYKPSRYVR